MKRSSRRSKEVLRLVRWVGVPLLASGAAAITLDVARRVFRRSQLFCPERPPVKGWNPADYGIDAARVEELWFETPDGQLLYGWYCRAEKPIASAVFCHGNTGNITTIAEVIPHLMNAGFNVLLFDYRGFGRSTGSSSLAGVVSDAITAAREHERIRPKNLPSLLYGYSLGGAISAQVVRHHPFDGMILQSTFTNLRDIARVTFPRLPLHLFAGSVFDTAGVIRKLNVPLLIIHGDNDEVIPCWMAHSIYDACRGPKRIHIVRQGLHKDLFIRDADALIWVLSQFVADLPPQRAHLPLDQPSIFELWLDDTLRRARRPFRRRPAPEVP